MRSMVVGQRRRRATGGRAQRPILIRERRSRRPRAARPPRFAPERITYFGNGPALLSALAGVLPIFAPIQWAVSISLPRS